MPQNTAGPAHIYDKLFTTAASRDEWKLTTSFQRRQQLLPKRQQQFNSRFNFNSLIASVSTDEFIQR